MYWQGYSGVVFREIEDIQSEKERGIFMCDYGKEIFSGLKNGFKVVGRGEDVWKEMK